MSDEKEYYSNHAAYLRDSSGLLYLKDYDHNTIYSIEERSNEDRWAIEVDESELGSLFLTTPRFRLLRWVCITEIDLCYCIYTELYYNITSKEEDIADIFNEWEEDYYISDWNYKVPVPTNEIDGVLIDLAGNAKMAERKIVNAYH